MYTFTEDILVAPALPQMAADGVIDLNDLTQADAVIITVQASAHTAKGDYLVLYWNGIQAGLLSIDTDVISDFFPWITYVPASLVPDGSYPVMYTRKDAALNMLASPIVTALVQRKNTGDLPAPTFPEAIDNVLVQGVIADGTPIRVPAYSGIAENDVVQVSWVGSTPQGQTIPESVVAMNYIVSTQDIVGGFDVMIAAPYISVIGQGVATSWYTSQPAGGLFPSSSKLATVEVDILEDSLPRPIFTEGGDGWIDAQEASSDGGTPLLVPVYPGMTINDRVTTHWQGLVNSSPVPTAVNIQTHTIIAADLLSGFMQIIPTNAITPVGIGEGQAYYQVSFADGRTGSSVAANINVDTLHGQLLPAPLFPEAIGGVLTLAQAADGTVMQISYPGMVAGDGITLYWQGYQQDGVTPAPEASYSEVHILSALEGQAQQLTTTIPADYITRIGEGYAAGQYQVSFSAGGMANSTFTQIKIMTQEANTFQLTTTTGAPYWHSPADIVRPYNVVTVAATPGTEVEIALSSSAQAWFDDGTQIWRGTLTQDGYVNLSVYSMAAGAVGVSAYDIHDVNSYASRTMVFNDYYTGNGDLAGYGYSSGAPANGATVNSLYVLASDNPNITRATFNVSGSATITGYGKTAIINLSSSRTAAINVVDSTPELSTFTINTMQSPIPSSVTNDFEFVAFPITKEFSYE